jgi:hypothetical protein
MRTAGPAVMLSRVLI